MIDKEHVIYENSVNNYSPDDLKQLCSKLESMTKINQVEALRIFHKHNKEMINENKYGIHINVTDVEDIVLKEIEEFIDHISKQEKQLIEMEELQNDIQGKYIDKTY
jgi:DnaJ-domain-containing protein 1